MVATWLTELYLDQINRAMLDAHAGVGDSSDATVAALEQQLQVCSESSRCIICTHCEGAEASSIGSLRGLLVELWRLATVQLRLLHACSCRSSCKFQWCEDCCVSCCRRF